VAVVPGFVGEPPDCLSIAGSRVKGQRDQRFKRSRYAMLLIH
jgi:hypothetical protein